MGTWSLPYNQMRMNWICALLLLLTALNLSWGGRLLAAEPQGRFLFKTYGIEEGLMEPALGTMVQDRDGFLWIASENGLLRYDGATFRRWGTAAGLPSSFIHALLPVPTGGLWVATAKGVVRFRDGKVLPFQVGGQPFVALRAQLDLDAQGSLWLIREDGLYHQKGEAGAEKVADLPAGPPKALVLNPVTGSCFLAAGDALWERKASGTWTRWTFQDGLPTDGIETLAVDGRGRVWVVGTRSLCYLEAQGGVLHDVSSWLPSSPFTGGIIHRNPDGSVAIPTNGGLLRIQGDRHDVLDAAAGLPCKWTGSSLVDREGNLWVVGPRIYRLLGREYVRTFTERDGLPNDLIWSVTRDRLGRLWAGTSNGLARLGPGGWVPVPGTEGHSVCSLALDAANRLYIGSNNRPLRFLDPQATTAVAFPLAGLTWDGPAGPGPGPKLPGRSTAVLVDAAGLVWLSDPNLGLFVIDRARNSLHLEPAAPEAGGLLRIGQLYADPQGRLWGSTPTGLLTRDGQGWHRWTRAQGLLDDALLGLAAVGDGSFWVLYQESVGIQRVAWEGQALRVLEQLDTTKGLSSNMAYAAALDARGNLWVGSNRGVDRLRGAERFHLGQGGGMPGEDCSGNGMFAESNGDLWVGTSTGLAHILAEQQPAPLGPTPVFIVEILRGKATLTPPFASLPPLSHRDASLEFRFACPTYVNEKAVVYQVRMVGLEEDWRSLDGPQARYLALPSGSYRFEVRAGYPGHPFGPAATYAVAILPPWWRTWWFLGLLILGGGGLITLFLNRRLRTLGRQKRRLATLVDRRTEDLLKANRALEKANLALKAQSLSDPLTGLHNRRYLSVVVDDDVAAVLRSYRDSRQTLPLANQDLLFLMVDLDHFKSVNDTYGHPVGDQVLELVAAGLRKAARETDAVIRWGGEEFLIMARNASRVEGPLLAERIRSILADQELRLESGETLRWTCSVGFAAYPFQLEDAAWMGWERVVEIADAALYLAKKAGRDGWVGAKAKPRLQRKAHGPRLPWELLELKEEGVMELEASRAEAFKRPLRTGEIFG